VIDERIGCWVLHIVDICENIGLTEEGNTSLDVELGKLFISCCSLAESTAAVMLIFLVVFFWSVKWQWLRS
jgi:hypothetical protein